MKLVGFKIDVEQWAAFKKRAHGYDKTASSVLRDFIRWYNLAGDKWEYPFK